MSEKKDLKNKLIVALNSMDIKANSPKEFAMTGMAT